MLARNYSQSNNNRPVTSRDLEKISWVQTVSPAGLSQREKNAFYVLLAALRLCPQATRIVSTIGELAAVHRRAGLPGSPATIRRALAGLEEKGFLSRRRCRLGSARLGLELLVNRARWAYWTQTQVGKVVPLPKPPTSVYIPTRQSMGAGEDRTITQDAVNSQDININSSYARARGNNALYTWLSKHPVMLTLWCLLKGSTDMELFDRAKREVKAIEAQQAPEDPTGIPWEDFERHWDDMIPAVRESYAKSQILPKLRGEESSASASCSPPPSPPDEPPATDEERARIRKLIEESIESTSLPDDPAPSPAVSLLDDEQTRILLEARERARARCVD
jgi:hypothetical protein